MEEKRPYNKDPNIPIIAAADNTGWLLMMVLILSGSMTVAVVWMIRVRVESG